ncbi:uncharacterized protein LOC106170012 isoform X1 [Lingula anatina]|uniref:Uncharacterized protein LOC106170012 isoform X1 n=1 Tax=Lingula anatina TaxID=7574 RepID=A0A1S3J461_LINAN|nr:uncharacterized protein LOC106170012 isoform X1 [Lingula anatina]|eukprot:XP_013405170.1 uncharacterized protein LOC106170012 isoform X1 [Lingula anatina]
MLNWINLFLLGLLLAAENAFCGPVPESSAVEDKKLEDIKSKLANLQTLLQQLNRDKKSDVTTPLPLATVPPTESQNQEGETEKSEDDEVYSFLNKLTSEEVALLQDVKEKLQTARQLIITKAITGHNTKDREGELLHDDSTKTENHGHGSIKTDPNIPQVPANPTENKDKGHFLDKVWSESELGKVETRKA